MGFDLDVETIEFDHDTEGILIGSPHITFSGKLNWAKSGISSLSKDDIVKVIFNPPHTIVYFRDGDKIIVKATDDDEFQPEVGLAMAITKKIFGTREDYKRLVSNYVPKAKCPVCRKLLGVTTMGKYDFKEERFICPVCNYHYV